MLLLKMAEATSAMGIHTIDLGCGEYSYKERLMNGSIPTAKGSVELLRPATIARQIWRPLSKVSNKARHLVGKTPLGAVARRLRKPTD